MWMDKLFLILVLSSQCLAATKLRYTQIPIAQAIKEMKLNAPRSREPKQNDLSKEPEESFRVKDESLDIDEMQAPNFEAVQSKESIEEQGLETMTQSFENVKKTDKTAPLNFANALPQFQNPFALTILPEGTSNNQFFHGRNDPLIMLNDHHSALYAQTPPVDFYSPYSPVLLRSAHPAESSSSINTGKLVLGLGAGYLLYNAIKNNQQQQQYQNYYAQQQYAQYPQQHYYAQPVQSYPSYSYPYSGVGSYYGKAQPEVIQVPYHADLPTLARYKRDTSETLETGKQCCLN